MPAHAKEVDSRDKYGVIVIWVLVALVGLVSLMFAGVVAVFGSIWIGAVIAVLTVLGEVRLIAYTQDLIKATA